MRVRPVVPFCCGFLFLFSKSSSFFHRSPDVQHVLPNRDTHKNGVPHAKDICTTERFFSHLGRVGRSLCVLRLVATFKSHSRMSKSRSTFSGLETFNPVLQIWNLLLYALIYFVVNCCTLMWNKFYVRTPFPALLPRRASGFNTSLSVAMKLPRV